MAFSGFNSRPAQSAQPIGPSQSAGGNRLLNLGRNPWATGGTSTPASGYGSSTNATGTAFPSGMGSADMGPSDMGKTGAPVGPQVSPTNPNGPVGRPAAGPAPNPMRDAMMARINPLLELARNRFGAGAGQPAPPTPSAFIGDLMNRLPPQAQQAYQAAQTALTQKRAPAPQPGPMPGQDFWNQITSGAPAMPAMPQFPSTNRME